MNEYISKLINLLSSFLGEPYSISTATTQLTFGCPRCIENKGEKERSKHNLEVNLKKGVFQCWSCSQYDSEMSGSIKKLIKIYGNESILNEYISTLRALKESAMYKIDYQDSDFRIEFNNVVSSEVALPTNFQKLSPQNYNKRALDYLFSRRIGWDIINEYHIGFTKWDETQKQVSSRIIIPSLNRYGELNYWTGRDFTSLPKRQKYYNPKVERKDIIFNEDKINWDEDVILVEGPFDHLVVPNSIPLLGKVLKPSFALYAELNKKCHANVSIMLDGDASDDVKKIYKLLNHNELYGRVKAVPMPKELDPSKTYEVYGEKGIITYLRAACKIPDIFLG